MSSIDIEPGVLEAVAAASGHAYEQAITHIEAEFAAANGLYEPLLATLTPEGPYAYTLLGQVRPDGSVKLPILTTRDEHAAPAALGELTGRRLADPRRRPGDDGYALNTSTVPRLISTVSCMSSAYPPASVTHTGTPAARSVSRTSASRARSPGLVSASRPSRSPLYGSAPAR